MDQQDKSLELLRHQLGSIDLSDVQEEEEMSESERAEYCSIISAVFPRLEKDIKRLLYEQLLYGSNQAETWERVVFARGTFNGMDLLMEHWRKAHIEHTAKTLPQEQFDKSSPIGEV